MSVVCWRIVRASFADRAFDGEGARQLGGRWNSPGTPMVYSSTTIALAALELLVNLDSMKALHEQYCVIRAELPDDANLVELESIQDISPAVTIDDIAAIPANARTRAFGDAWCAMNRAVAVSVPSAVVPQERNLLLNPRHPDFATIQVDSPIPFAALARCGGPLRRE